MPPIFRILLNSFTIVQANLRLKPPCGMPVPLNAKSMAPTTVNSITTSTTAANTTSYPATITLNGRSHNDRNVLTVDSLRMAQQGSLHLQPIPNPTNTPSSTEHYALERWQTDPHDPWSSYFLGPRMKIKPETFHISLEPQSATHDCQLIAQQLGLELRAVLSSTNLQDYQQVSKHEI